MLLRVAEEKNFFTSLRWYNWVVLHLFHRRNHFSFPPSFDFPFLFVDFFGVVVRMREYFFIQFDEFLYRHFYFSRITLRSFSLSSLISLYCVIVWEILPIWGSYTRMMKGWNYINAPVSVCLLFPFFCNLLFIFMTIENVWFNETLITRHELNPVWIFHIDRDKIHGIFCFSLLKSIFLFRNYLKEKMRNEKFFFLFMRTICMITEKWTIKNKRDFFLHPTCMKFTVPGLPFFPSFFLSFIPISLCFKLCNFLQSIAFYSINSARIMKTICVMIWNINYQKKSWFSAILCSLDTALLLTDAIQEVLLMVSYAWIARLQYDVLEQSYTSRVWSRSAKNLFD